MANLAASPSLQSPPELDSLSTLEIAQALAIRLAITESDWHRSKSNRTIRAQEQLAAAMVMLIREQPDNALPHLHQAIGWLEKTISAPPCPDHGR